jgi:hypothetical protein
MSLLSFPNPKLVFGALRLVVPSWRVWAVSVAVLLAGCAALQPKPQDQVRQLATQRWQALLAGKFDQAYEFAVPSYRKIRSIDYYRANMGAVPVRWLKAEVLRIDCETQRCVVRIKLESEPRLPNFRGTRLETGIDEVWVRESGQWWMVEKI